MTFQLDIAVHDFHNATSIPSRRAGARPMRFTHVGPFPTRDEARTFVDQEVADYALLTKTPLVTDGGWENEFRGQYRSIREYNPQITRLVCYRVTEVIT